MVHLHLLAPRTIRTPAATISQRASILYGLTAYLIIERGKPVSRRRLLQFFWPNRPEHEARHPLRETLRKLRRRGIPILGNEQNVMIPKNAATIDVEELQHADIGDLVTHNLSILAGYDPPFSETYRDWLDDTRTRYTADVIRQLLEAVDYTKSIADWPMMHQLAERTLELSPTNQHALGALNHARRILRGLYTPPTHIIPARVRDMPSPTTLAPLGGHAAEQDTLLVGRTHDLTTLTNALNRARRGNGNTVTLQGPPGIGKSRLIRELTHIARYDDAVVVRTSAPSNYTSPPLHMWHEFTTRLLRTPGAGGCDPQTNTTLEQFAVNPSAFTDTLQSLCTATLDLINAIAYEQPLVIIMEDSHRADPESQLLTHLVSAAITNESILCVVTRHSTPNSYEQSHETNTRTNHEQTPHAIETPQESESPAAITHELPPIAQPAAMRHVEAYRAGIARRMPEELRAWCTHIANGNPYFAEELINAWTDAPHEPIAEAPPSSLTALIDTRLLRRDALSRRIIQSCAALGPHATLTRLARLAEASEWRTAAATAELRTNGFLTLGGNNTPGHQRVRCRHDLLAERALALLTPEDRHTLHDQTATLLERDLTTGDPSLTLAHSAHRRMAAEIIGSRAEASELPAYAEATGATHA